MGQVAGVRGGGEVRPGEIVRVSNGLIGTWCARGEFNASCIHHKHREGMAYTSVLESDVEIITVAELFKAAGHPVPEGGPLVVDAGLRWAVILERNFWSFTSPPWRSFPAQYVHAELIRTLVDLSRTHALDAWAAIPDEIKAVVA